MQLRRAIMAVTVSTLLLLPVLAFASGNSEQPSSTSKGPITVSIAHWDIDKSITGAPDAVYDWVKQKVGIEIKPVAVSFGDYRDKINVWAASGELHDAFSIDVVGSQIFKNWVSNGIVQALPADLGRYPNVKKIVDVPDVQAYQVDGKNWFIPRANYPDPNWWANDRGVIVRSDWMKKLGLQMPKTDNDFINVMVALATKDPDGDGVNDTVGLTTLTPGMLWGAFTDLAPHLAWPGWMKQDGKWVSTAVSREAYAYYSAVRRLYDAGGLDPDFAVQKSDDGVNKFGSGKAAAMAIQVAAKHWDKPAEVWKKLNPGTDFADVTDIVYERPDVNGQTWRFITASYWSETYLNSKDSPETVDAILRLYDTLMGPDFSTIKLWGFEGVDYKKASDGTIQSLLGLKADGTPKTATDKYPFLYSMSYFPTWGDEGQYQ